MNISETWNVHYTVQIWTWFHVDSPTHFEIVMSCCLFALPVIKLFVELKLHSKDKQTLKLKNA